MRVLKKPIVALKYHTLNPELEIEAAGRVCWESWGRSDGTLEAAQSFIARLKKVGHIDVLEESELSVWIECSRSCSHQVVRHRTQHFLQASQRYIKAKNPEILIPPKIDEDDLLRGNFLTLCKDAYFTYGALLASGVRAEDARYVLPNATLTKLKAKANFANWRKFIELRSDQTAQWEIRMISNQILKILFELAPAVFNDLAEKFLTEEAIYATRLGRGHFDNVNIKYDSCYDWEEVEDYEW